VDFNRELQPATTYVRDFRLMRYVCSQHFAFQLESHSLTLSPICNVACSCMRKAEARVPRVKYKSKVTTSKEESFFVLAPTQPIVLRLPASSVPCPTEIVCSPLSLVPPGDRTHSLCANFIDGFRFSFLSMSAKKPTRAHP